MSQVAKELREACARLRQRPIPLADMIPLMQRAADALDAKEAADDGGLHIAYLKGYGDGRDFCLRTIQDAVRRWDGPWKRAGEWLAANIGQRDDMPAETQQ